MSSDPKPVDCCIALLTFANEQKQISDATDHKIQTDNKEPIGDEPVSGASHGRRINR